MRCTIKKKGIRTTERAENFAVIASGTSIKQSIASKIKQSAIDKTFGMY